MRKRWIAVIGGALLAGVLAIGGVGAALAYAASNGVGPFANRQYVATQQAQFGPGSMMDNADEYGYGQMGRGGMMNGYGPGLYQQNQTNTATVAANTVIIRDMAYYPSNIEVKVGTTVTWINYSRGTHTVTFADNSITSSGALAQGDTFSYTFTKAGVYTYTCDYCALHETMTGTVTVTA